jgi:hypothetical protein
LSNNRARSWVRNRSQGVCKLIQKEKMFTTPLVVLDRT